MIASNASASDFVTGSTAAKVPLPKDEWTARLSYVTMYRADPPPGR